MIDLDELEEVEQVKTENDKKTDWLKQRAGKFTASEFYRIMTYADKKPNELPAGAIKYVREKVAESLTEFDDDSNGFLNAAMQWGIDHEHEAVDLFEKKTGLKVIQSKDAQVFLSYDEHSGGTPDGLIDSKPEGLEIKCPNSDTHINFLSVKNGDDLKEINPKYYWQCIGLMLITGFEKWYFVSYDPRFKNEKHRLHIAEIEHNEHDLILLELRLSMAVKLKNEILDSIN